MVSRTAPAGFRLKAGLRTFFSSLLEQIGRNSEQYDWPIMEILSAYVREKCKKDYAEAEIKYQSSDEPPELDPDGEHDLDHCEQPPNPLTTLIQTVLLVLGRRGGLNEQAQRFDLHSCILNKANLAGSCLDRANLTESHLVMMEARGVRLQGALLKNAELCYAKLSEARLEGAHLNGAILRNAILRGANLTGAYLEGADLSGADLAGTYLWGDLRKAKGLTQKQINIAFIRENTQLPNGLQRPRDTTS